MATTHENNINIESDGAHVTFVKDHHLGLAADDAKETPGGIEVAQRQRGPRPHQARLCG